MSTHSGSILFPTSLGSCAIAWSPVGVTAVALPGVDDAATVSHVDRLHGHDAMRERPAVVPSAITVAVERIVALLTGVADDLRSVTLDLRGIGVFERRVYDQARLIGPGDTCTYGALASAIGQPGAARAVGGALGRNPFPIIVPCHRVVAAGGGVGGFSGAGGVATKLKMLAIEDANVPILRAPRLFS